MWNNTACDAPDTQSVKEHPNCDVVIIGAGFTGRNAAMGSMMGSLLAEQVLSGEGPESAFPITHPNKFKLHAFRDIGVSAAIKWYTLRDYLEGL